MPLSIHLFGPLSIHIYGSMIAAGVMAALLGLNYDAERKKILTMHELYLLVAVAIIAGVAGGKLLYLIEYMSEGHSWSELLEFWNNGFSVLGAFIAVPLVVGFLMYRYRLPVIKSFDRASIYIPLMFAISRLGCFFAGCCYGIPTGSRWGIIYTDPTSIAPLDTPLHPTQLYSAGLEFLLFVLLFTIGQRTLKKTGQLFGTYLLLMSTERFFVDFLRGDRTLVTESLSFSQLAAGGVGMIGLAILLLATFTTFFGSSSQRVHS